MCLIRVNSRLRDLESTEQNRTEHLLAFLNLIFKLFITFSILVFRDFRILAIS